MVVVVVVVVVLCAGCESFFSSRVSPVTVGGEADFVSVSADHGDRGARRLHRCIRAGTGDELCVGVFSLAHVGFVIVVTTGQTEPR